MNETLIVAVDTPHDSVVTGSRCLHRGTIGSVRKDPKDPLSPFIPGSWQDIMELPSIHDALSDLQKDDGLTIEGEEFNPTLDSANISPNDWIRIARAISSHYDE